jgi:hypothetical protein
MRDNLNSGIEKFLIIPRVIGMMMRHDQVLDGLIRSPRRPVLRTLVRWTPSPWATLRLNCITSAGLIPAAIPLCISPI